MIFTITQYIYYFFRSKTKYKIHSPFVYSFIAEILEKKVDEEKLREIKQLKSFYKKSNQQISREDYGAGSVTSKNNNDLIIKKIVDRVSIHTKYGKILYNISKFYRSKTCIELGTSLGISTLYLNNKNNKITSIEGNKKLLEYTKNTFSHQKINGINFISEKFDTIFEKVLKEEKSFDLLFIDGNHTEKATLNYFRTALKYKNQKSIIIFDDIYWSTGMKNAWNTIVKDKKVMLSIDLFQLGIIFFDKDFMTKEHYTLWY